MAKLNAFLKEYTVFDLETTGLSPERDEIIEISGIQVRNGEVTGQFSTLVNPGRPIPSGASRINGITDKMVQEAPVLKTALEDFLAFAGSDSLVGHNIHSFDMKFLSAAAHRELRRDISNDYVDTLYLARNLLPLTRFSLTDVASYFHVDTECAHRALNDCRMNWQCYEQMRALWEKQSGEGKNAAIRDCPRCGSPLVRRKGRYGDFWGCSSFPRCRFTENIRVQE